MHSPTRTYIPLLWQVISKFLGDTEAYLEKLANKVAMVRERHACAFKSVGVAPACVWI